MLLYMVTILHIARSTHVELTDYVNTRTFEVVYFVLSSPGWIIFTHRAFGK